MQERAGRRVRAALAGPPASDRSMEWRHETKSESGSGVKTWLRLLPPLALSRPHGSRLLSSITIIPHDAMGRDRSRSRTPVGARRARSPDRRSPRRESKKASTHDDYDSDQQKRRRSRSQDDDRGDYSRRRRDDSRDRDQEVRSSKKERSRSRERDKDRKEKK